MTPRDDARGDLPEPADPHEAGVPEARPDENVGPDDAHIEGAHVLASQARERLEPRGFDEHQILLWAEAYVEQKGGGNVDAFLEWVSRQEEDGS